MDNNQTFLNACRNGQKSIVQIFLKKGGIDINKRDQEGNTALYYACQKGYRDIVALLLDNDADASCINNRSESPLHAAARSGNKEILGKLLQKGADINVTDNEGRTPLICLLDNKRTDAALFLMDQGADTEVADASGHKAIDYATAHGLREVVARLSCGNDRDARGNTPLHQAVYNGQGEIVRTLLLSDKSMLDSTNDGGETPLILACMQGNLVMVNLLLGTGADPGKAMLSGNAPIHYAAISGNRFIGEALLKAKAAVDAQNDNGETPLILAAKEGHNDFVSVLLEFHANVSISDNLQHTALYYAGERGFNGWCHLTARPHARQAMSLLLPEPVLFGMYIPAHKFCSVLPDADGIKKKVKRRRS